MSERRTAPKHYYAPLVPEDCVPATVHDLPPIGRRKRAAVTHPAGPQHINAVLARHRLLERGYLVVPLQQETGPS